MAVARGTFLMIFGPKSIKFIINRFGCCREYSDCLHGSDECDPATAHWSIYPKKTPLSSV